MAVLVEVFLQADYFGSQNLNPEPGLIAVAVEQQQVRALHFKNGTFTFRGEGMSAIVVTPIMPGSKRPVHFRICVDGVFRGARPNQHLLGTVQMRTELCIGVRSIIRYLVSAGT